MSEGRREIRLSENEQQEYLWVGRERSTHFANRRTRCGQNFDGVEQTIGKPHGLQSVIRDLVQLVAVTGLRRWSAILSRLAKRYPPSHVQEGLEVAISAGIIAASERNLRPNKGEFWELQEIEVDARAQEELRRTYPACARELDPAEVLARAASGVVAQWTPSADPICRHLEGLVGEGISRLRGGEGLAFDLPVSGAVRYRSVLLTLAYARLALGKGETMALRTLSANLWDNTKVLERYVEDILRLAGVSLGRLGLTAHPDVLWAYGDVTVASDYGVVNLLVGQPPLIAEDTVMGGELHVGASVGAVLVIENLTPFLALLARRYYGRQDTLVIWSSGYMGQLHQYFLRQVLAARPLPVYIWADMDGDGMTIAHQVCRLAETAGATANVILMDEVAWRLGIGRRPASDRDVALAVNPDLVTRFPDLCRLIVEERLTLEQEALLGHWECLLELLP